MNDDQMTFPNTWEEFEKEYGFTDTDEIYTNGSRLIQSFRVEQWLEHLQAVPVRHGKFIGTESDGYADGNPVYYEWKCSECGCIFEEEEPTYRYCPNCGARMDEE